jgi:hypothetical protein
VCAPSSFTWRIDKVIPWILKGTVWPFRYLEGQMMCGEMRKLA